MCVKSLNARRRAARVIFVAAAAAGVVLTSFAGPALAQTNATWLVGAGSWGDATRWSGGVVPFDTTTTGFNVFIDGGNETSSVVELNYGSNRNTTVDTFSLSAGDVLNIDNTDRLVVAKGALVNQGTINLNSTGVFTNINLANGTLSGGGTVTMGNNANNNIRVQTPGTRFTNLDNLIQGSGRIGADQAMALTNSGTILANQSVPLIVAPGFQTQSYNTGWLRATGGAELQIHGKASLDNSGGTISADGGGTVTLLNSIAVTGGRISVDGGTFRVTSGSADVESITGAGTTSLAAGTLSGGTLGVDYLRGGTLSISGGAMSVHSGATAASGASVVSSLAITGTGSLDLRDNSLAIDYTGASPADAVRAMLASGSLNSSAASASVSPKTALGYVDNLDGAITSFGGQPVDDSSVLIRYTAAGDANLDGKVDTLDFNALAANFGASGQLWNGGDFNYDGVVDTLDFNALAGNFGARLPGNSARASMPVPEPAALLSLCAVGLLARRRRAARPRAFSCRQSRFS